MPLARNVVTVGTASLAVADSLAFVREVLIAAVLGAGALADAFFVAAQIPNLFRRLLTEGALNAAFVPLWLRIRGMKAPIAPHGGSAKTCLACCCIGLAAIAVLCVLFAPTLVQLLAPGFRGRQRAVSCLPSTSCGWPTPYIAFAGVGGGRGGGAERRRARRGGSLRHRRFQLRDDRCGRRRSSFLVSAIRRRAGAGAGGARSSSAASRNCCWSAAHCYGCPMRRARHSSACQPASAAFSAGCCPALSPPASRSSP